MNLHLLLGSFTEMVRAVKGKPATQKKDIKKDEFSLATLQEIKRDKHRDCETVVLAESSEV